jgi:hypothetical protein
MKFKDRLRPKERKQSKEPWDFKKPTYDQARAGSISAGDSYGLGVTQPVGTDSVSSISPIPKGCYRFSADAVIDGEV